MSRTTKQYKPKSKVDKQDPNKSSYITNNAKSKNRNNAQANAKKSV